MNTKLLRQIEKVILEEPKRLNMAIPVSQQVWHDLPACSTTGCIAGWACILSKTTYSRRASKVKEIAEPLAKMDWRPVKTKAVLSLRISQDQAWRLFHVENWPNRFLRRYSHSKTKITTAKITVARIEHFIKTKGED